MNAPAAMPEQLLEAALGYAARGWPVFPCNPKNKQPLLAGDKDRDGNPIKGTGGVKKASTDPEQIRTWWKKWPQALVGLATGHPTRGTETDAQPAGLRLFVVDFDPRADEDTGELWTLEQLKADFEQQIGCTLPQSQTARTPSDGVHLYLLIGDAGEAIKNSASKFTEHVDVRGLGGYVIAPPSRMGPNALKGQAGLRYRWHREAELALAPPELLEILRQRGKPAAAAPAARPAFQSRPSTGQQVDDAVRKYALSALDGELQSVRTAPSGRRNAQLNTSALKIASLVAAGALDDRIARMSLEAAARDNAGNDDDRQLSATIESGWTAGIANPRDLAEVAAAARSRSERGPRRDPSGARPPAPAAAGRTGAPFQNGRLERDPAPHGAEAEPVILEGADLERMRMIASAWLRRRLEQDLTGEELGRVAFGAGCRISADLLGEDAGRELLEVKLLEVEGLTFDDLGDAIESGMRRGYNPGATLLDLKCSGYPLTDFGLGERFRDRYGAEFRFTTAKGWLGWDGRRWKVLDQDQDTPPAELVAAVFDTVRSLQREAKRVRETGTKWELIHYVGPRGGEKQRIADEDDQDPNPHALDYWIAKGAGFVRYSEAIAAFGRTSEAAGKPGAIGALARRWLTVAIEDFDCEQMAINALNGTIRFEIEKLPDGKRSATVRLDGHRREDLITKLAPVEYDPKAPAPLYDGMIEWAQPDPALRQYLHQVGGYACSGHTGEHKLWFHYGRGRNGKSTTIDSWCSALGDYSGTIGIESFLDQGIKKRGDAATPDLAKLGGVRFLRASEPERGAKLNSALIKGATGGEPMSVRALHRGFFDLLPRFKLHMSGNSKPAIPDTDEGIWDRMKLVPWRRHINKPDEDPYRDTFPCADWPQIDYELTAKIKDKELAGVFARLVAGLVGYLEHGFLEPEAVKQATADYRNQSDPLARFLELCTVRKDESRVKSSDLHAVFAAWCKAAGEKEWSTKGFSDALQDKGFVKTRSDGMRWEGLELVRQVEDFVDETGNVRLLSDDLSAEPARSSSSKVEDLPV